MTLQLGRPLPRRLAKHKQRIVTFFSYASFCADCSPQERCKGQHGFGETLECSQGALDQLWLGFRVCRKELQRLQSVVGPAGRKPTEVEHLRCGWFNLLLHGWRSFA